MEEKDKKFISHVSHEIVNELAPSELILFNDIEEQFFKNPEALLTKDKKKREKMLGFALPAGSEQFITVVVLPIVYKIIEKYFGKKEKVGKLDTDKIKRLREEVYDNAIASGIKSEKAGLMADSFVGKMVQMGY